MFQCSYKNLFAMLVPFLHQSTVFVLLKKPLKTYLLLTWIDLMHVSIQITDKQMLPICNSFELGRTVWNTYKIRNYSIYCYYNKTKGKKVEKDEVKLQWKFQTVTVRWSAYEWNHLTFNVTNNYQLHNKSSRHVFTSNMLIIWNEKSKTTNAHHWSSVCAS